MRRYEQRQVSITRYVEVEARCDGCGILEDDAESGILIDVAIEVSTEEEFGRRDEYDYCNACLVERADALRAAGSRSELVGGEPPNPEEEQ